MSSGEAALVSPGSGGGGGGSGEQAGSAPFSDSSPPPASPAENPMEAAAVDAATQGNHAQEEEEEDDDGAPGVISIRSSGRKRRRALRLQDDSDDEAEAGTQDGGGQPETAGDPRESLRQHIQQIMHADMAGATLKSVREALRARFGYDRALIKKLRPQIKTICEEVARDWRDTGAAEDDAEAENDGAEGHGAGHGDDGAEGQPKRKRLRLSKSGSRSKGKHAAAKQAKDSEGSDAEDGGSGSGEDDDEDSADPGDEDDGDDPEDSDASDTGGDRKKRRKAKREKRKKKKAKRSRHRDRDSSEGDGSEDEDEGGSGGGRKVRLGPKRPLSAYMFFTAANRAKVREELPELSFGEITRALGERWRQLTEVDRAPYDEQAKQDKVRYQTELRRWRIEHPEEVEAAEAAAAAAKRKRSSAATGSSSSSSSRKKRSPRSELDGEYDELAGGGLEGTGGAGAEPSEFDKLLNSLKRSKPKPRSNIEEIRGEAEFFVKRMIAAWQTDTRAFRAREPAIERMTMLKEVEVECGKQVLQEHLLDAGVLKAINLWLKPLGNDREELPNINLRRPLYQILSKLPIDENHLLNSDGLGKRINRLWQREEPKSPERTALQHLLEKWMRPVVGSVTDYKKLEAMERRNGEDMLARRRILEEADARLKVQYQRSSIARQTTFDFLIRPESKISFEDAEEEARSAAANGAADLRRQLKRAVLAKPKSHHVTVNVTGSKKRKL